MVGVGGPKFLLGKQISSTNKRTMKLTDGRLQLIHDWLTKMKLLRLHGWERFGLRRIEAVRRQELACLWQYSLQWAWSTFFTQVQDSSFSFSSLVLCIWIHFFRPLSRCLPSFHGASRTSYAACTLRWMRRPSG